MKLRNSQISTLLLVLLSSTVACQKAQTDRPATNERLAGQKTNEPIVAAASPTPSPTREVTLDRGWKLKPKEFKDVNRRLRYSISGQYPVVNEATDSRVQRLNQEIKRSIAKRYSYITAPNLKEFREHVLAFPEEEALQTAEFDYEVMESTKGLLSIRFHETTYSLGAAHPLQGYFTVNFATNSGKVMKIRDVFDPKFNYLKFLSQFCAESIGVLEPWKDAVWKPSSFESWNIRGETLVINFDRCEVSACADGARTVVIPFKEFSAHLNKGNPVFRISGA